MSSINALKINSDQNGNEEQSDTEDTCRIRNSLSILSFEELINLKQKVGSRVYNQTVYDERSFKTAKGPKVKRANKNRPRELSSKIGQQKIKALIKNSNIIIPNHSEDNRPRDPRFDPACGEFNNFEFTKSYSFVDDIRKQEKNELEKEFRKCTDPEKKETIKLLIQRIENKLSSKRSTDNKQRKKGNEGRDIKGKREQREKPIFKNKSVKKLENLVEKYEELKKTNKLQKHVEKRVKKNKKLLSTCPV